MKDYTLLYITRMKGKKHGRNYFRKPYFIELGQLSY